MLGKVKNFYSKLQNFLEKYMVLFTIVFFLVGIVLAKFSATFAGVIDSGINGFVDAYGYVAPPAIFLILAPSLAKLLTSKAGKFGTYAVVWLAVRRLLACIWAAIFTVLIFGFPFFSQEGVGMGEAIITALKTVGIMAYTSPFMLAIWCGIVVGIVSVKVKWLFKFLEKFLNGFEAVGQHFLLFVPLFMMAIGSYVYNLPAAVGQIDIGNIAFTLQNVTVFGFDINPNTASGMIWVYVVGALLVGLVCFGWHFVLLFITKRKVKYFSIKKYFLKYWVKVYPLLWSTSSEALSTPLNLYLTKKYFPEVHSTVRRFVVGMGSYLNINGTLICVFVLGGVVTSMLGYSPSLVEWLLVVPIVFLLGYGVPGIPGELVLFAGPIALLLNLPEEIVPIFLALYIGLQLGLPDSFRTGNNSTDNCVCAVLLNEVYNKKFAVSETKFLEQQEENLFFSNNKNVQ